MSDKLQVKEDVRRQIIKDTAILLAGLLDRDMNGIGCIAAIHAFARGIQECNLQDCKRANPPASSVNPGMNVAEFCEWLATQDQEAVVYVLEAPDIIKNGFSVKFLFDPEKHSHYCSPGYVSYSTLLIGGI